ncbi:MAG: substrate-binding domain-containing protein, partial [Rhodospirillales bacterium]|nr:substrate-binding domain-containing protein [Rhodospirillales bacterium]
MAAILGACALLAGSWGAAAEERFITVASTTSTEQSGLFGYLLPLFTAKTGISVRVVAQGTGQALRSGTKGDADVVFVHDPEAESRFVTAGHGIEHRRVMYNDFVLVGPKSDPAGIRGLTDAVEALRRIAGKASPFASRGDNSGTHAAELRLWQDARIDLASVAGAWYRETGSGMGPTLNVAAGMEAYVLADRGTWLNFKNRGTLEILAQGDRKMFNQYGVMLVNPERHPHV